MSESGILPTEVDLEVVLSGMDYIACWWFDVGSKRWST